MVFLKKLKEVLISILPIAAIILVLHFTICPFETKTLINFLIAVVLLSLGEVFFLTGVDSTIMTMGEMVGGSVNKVSKFCLFLLFAFLFGMFATIAEPDVQVFADQVIEVGALTINKYALMFIIGAGVGLFIAFALLRILKHINLKFVLTGGVLLLFLIAAFVPDSFIAIAFDSGGCTVGIVTTPFLLSLASGVVEKSSKNSIDNFGVVGVASLGPVLAMLLLGLFVRGNGATTVVESMSYNIFVDVLYNTAMAIIPLVAVFYIFQILYLKLPKRKKLAMAVGVLVTFVGFYLFLFAINLGFTTAGAAMGEKLSSQSLWVIILVYLVFAFAIVFTEPAIRVLGAQVESITQGNINRKIIIIGIAIAMMLAVVLSVLRVYYNFSIWYILGIGYGLAIILMLFSPSLFVSIAFDSGGVASGPISTAILLPAIRALAGSTAEGFGFIGILAVTPIIVVEFIGVIYNIKILGLKKNRQKVALRISYGAEKYSNMEKLEKRYKQILANKQQGGNEND